jgi:nucleoside-diphosphate-sugar epimerase
MVQWVGEKMQAAEMLRFKKNEGKPQQMIAEANRLFLEAEWQSKYELSHALDQTIEWWKNQNLVSDR